MEQPDGDRVSLGNFDTEEEAALNYDYHAKIVFGDCYLNFPNYDLSDFIPQKKLISRQKTKLTAEKVMQIDSLIQLGKSNKTIALEIGIYNQTVANIRNRYTYKNSLQ